MGIYWVPHHFPYEAPHSPVSSHAFCRVGRLAEAEAGKPPPRVSSMFLAEAEHFQCQGFLQRPPIVYHPSHKLPIPFPLLGGPRNFPLNGGSTIRGGSLEFHKRQSVDCTCSWQTHINPWSEKRLEPQVFSPWKRRFRTWKPSFSGSILNFRRVIVWVNHHMLPVCISVKLSEISLPPLFTHQSDPPTILWYPNPKKRASSSPARNFDPIYLLFYQDGRPFKRPDWNEGFVEKKHLWIPRVTLKEVDPDFFLLCVCVCSLFLLRGPFSPYKTLPKFLMEVENGTQKEDKFNLQRGPGVHGNHGLLEKEYRINIGVTSSSRGPIFQFRGIQTHVDSHVKILIPEGTLRPLISDRKILRDQNHLSLHQTNHEFWFCS